MPKLEYIEPELMEAKKPTSDPDVGNDNKHSNIKALINVQCLK